MFETIATLMRGAAARSTEQLRDANAVLLLEQKIRDIGTQHESSKRILAGMIAQVKSLKRNTQALQKSTDDLEQRAIIAMAANRNKLAAEAAQAIADNENELAGKRKAIESLEIEIARLRALVEKTNRRQLELRQGLVVARHTEYARKSRVNTLKSLNKGQHSVQDAEQMLDKILSRTETEEALSEYERLNDELSGAAITDKLAEAGFGDPLKVRADDVLARLKKSTKKNRANKN